MIGRLLHFLRQLWLGHLRRKRFDLDQRLRKVDLRVRRLTNTLYFPDAVDPHDDGDARNVGYYDH